MLTCVWQNKKNCIIAYVVCTPQWSEFVNQNSINGVRYDAYRTVSSCQDYCVSVQACVAVDFNFIDTSCWLHVDADDLLEDNIYYQDRTNQYQLDRTCATHTTTTTS